MATTALFVEIVDVLVSAADPLHLLPGVAAAMKRLQLRGVPIIAVSDRLNLEDNAVKTYADKLRAIVAAENCELKDIIITTTSSPASWTKPRPGMLLAAGRSHDIDVPNSWMIGTHADDARAAAQAGCAGAVIVGEGALPANDIGIVVAQARDLADAPRVMIPRNGGCWHQM